MELLRELMDYVLHIDRHLDGLILDWGKWFYALMFLIIFCETGLVFTPILPGDSLLFALGAFAARDSLSLSLLLVLLTIAAILGDTCNYWMGRWLGPKIFRGEKIWLLRQSHLERTQVFFEKYGGKTIILARFVPIVRTFAPFVAGMGKMTYRKFMSFNVIGAFVWIFLFTLAGFFFGGIPVVKNNFTAVMLGIIVVSVLPAVVEVIREKARLKRERRS